MRVVFFFLIALLCSLNAPKAQANSEVPVKIQGNWASPDCGHYSEAVILTRSFYLKAGKKETTLLQAVLAGEAKDYWTLLLGSDRRPARLEEDGILKIAEGKIGAEWDDEKLQSRMEYTACTDVPTLVPKMLARVMRYVDRIRQQCTISLKNDCARVLFKMTDANTDKKLTPSEIKRTVATALLFAELAAKKTITAAEAEKIAERSKTESQKIADALMADHDKDKSGSLDYNEIAANFTAPKLPVIKETLVKMGALLPAFKVAAMGLD